MIVLFPGIVMKYVLNRTPFFFLFFLPYSKIRVEFQTKNKIGLFCL